MRLSSLSRADAPSAGVPVAEIEAKGTEASDPGIVLKAGARLVREWAGQMHTVVVLENRFDYDGDRTVAQQDRRTGSPACTGTC